MIVKSLLYLMAAGIVFVLSDTVYANEKSDAITSLTYITEEYRPYNYSENGVVTGISVELLKLIWKKMGVNEEPIHVYPWARGYHDLLSKKQHVLFATSRTAERKTLFKWVGPIYKIKNILVGLSKNNFKLKTLSDAKQYQIGTIREDVSEQLLVAAGFELGKLQKVKNLEQNLKKLRYGRVDLVAITDKSLQEYIELDTKKAQEFEIVFTFKEVSSYYAFSQDVSDFVVEEFQNALDNLHQEHEELLEQFMGNVK